MAPAEELRAAAAKIRERVTGATVPGRETWHHDSTRASKAPVVVDLVGGNCTTLIEAFSGKYEAVNAYLVGVASPHIALLVADWLDCTADEMEDEHAHVVDHPEWTDDAEDRRWGVYGANSSADSEPWKCALIAARALTGGAR